VNISVAQIENNLRFPGQYYDAETRLHYNWNRYYNPETGRYIAADPIGLGGGMNLYVYVGADPVSSVDPWGLKVELCQRPAQIIWGIRDVQLSGSVIIVSFTR
jgi:RHS repeat-associated protein